MDAALTREIIAQANAGDLESVLRETADLGEEGNDALWRARMRRYREEKGSDARNGEVGGGVVNPFREVVNRNRRRVSGSLSPRSRRV